MLCLPEEVIYWWLARIRSNSPELDAIQFEINHVLYNYFKGSFIGRTNFLKEKTQKQIKKEEAFNKLKETPEWKVFEEADHEVKEVNKRLKDSDEKVISEQMELWALDVKTEATPVS